MKQLNILKKKYIAIILVISIIIQYAGYDAFAMNVREYIDGFIQTASNIEFVDEKKNEVISNDEPIKIYSFEQLKKIGSGETIESDGVERTFSNDADYMIMNDIVIPKDDSWALPFGFDGKFVDNGENKEIDLYDKSTNTVKIYNNYQLQEIGNENSPVMSNDAESEMFGSGKPVYDQNKDMVTYGDKDTNFVISEDFTEDMTVPISAANTNEWKKADGEDFAGRDYPGQVYKEINGEKYILIGNEQQLRAIGSNKYVTPRMYKYAVYVEVTGIFPLLDRREYTSYMPYYPGDADINLINDYQNNNWEESYELLNIHTKDKGLISEILEGLGDIIDDILSIVLPGTYLKEKGMCGVNTEETKGIIGEANKDVLIFDNKDLKYTSDANYIVFRNIDLSSNLENTSTGNGNGKIDDWTPINISGNFEGKLGMVDGNSVTISNINVNTSGVLDPSTTIGIGFFGTVSSKFDSSFKSLSSTVKNINLDNVKVNNGYTSINTEVDSLAEALLGGLGWLLGGILGGVEDLIGAILPDINLNLKDLIKGLLNVKISSEDVFATGSFAGRITGNVKVENCNVTNASVSSTKSMLGGFVGYTEGTEEYDRLSEILGGSTELLVSLLNILPGIGLGDIITVLLDGNILNLDQLIPTEYIKPEITNSSVLLENGNIGELDSDYNGGFAGLQKSTKTENCTVTGLTSVKAANGAGGFVGTSRDAIVKGLLEDLGVSLSKLDIKNEYNACSANGTNIDIVSSENYAGGFVGLMTNSKATNSHINNLSSIKVEKVGTGNLFNEKDSDNLGNYAGGFAGRATVGYGASIGGKDETNSLISSVGGLLEDAIAGGNDDTVSTLLNIAGIEASELISCGITGENITVSATGNYAGGFVGQGDGLKINPNEKSENGTTSSTGSITIDNLSSVTANKYVGGAIGSVSTADAIGILNNTIGVGKYIKFEINNLTINGKQGTGLVVKAKDSYAAGGIALAVGGDINKVDIKNISSVTSKNYSAGFVGRAGTSGLSDTKGLDLLGLGLVKVDNVLSLADGTKINIKESSAEGKSDTGYIVSATGYTDLITNTDNIMAGGFIAESASANIENSKVKYLKSVTAPTANGKGNDYKIDSYAGGFVGRTHTGGLLGLANEGEDGKLSLPGILDVESLINLVPYLIPKFKDCTVEFFKVEKLDSSTGDDNKETVEEVKVEDTTKNSDESENTSDTEDSSNKIDSSNNLINMWNNIKENKELDNIESQVTADYAGGFAGEIESAKVDNAESETTSNSQNNSALGNEGEMSDITASESDKQEVSEKNAEKATESSNNADDKAEVSSTEKNKSNTTTTVENNRIYAVFNLERVDGYKYAGGFAGNIVAGGIASSDGLKLLGGITLDISNLLSVLNIYIPKINNAGVSSVEKGFIVISDSEDGYAGGYAGKASGAKISNSDVSKLKNTTVTPPTDGFESDDASSYFSENLSAYAVRAGRYAGGYIGRADIDSAAAVGGGIKLLGNSIGLDNILSAIDVVTTDITNSNVYGASGGYSVIADGIDSTNSNLINQEEVGHAGGFAGFISGTNIENSNSYNFNYIIGRETAGGHTGKAEPGNTASVVEDAGILGNLVDIEGGLAGVLNTFIPQIINSETTSVPCGGAVRAEGESDGMYNRGYAGGYIGHNEGGRIKGNDSSKEGSKEAATVRIRSVYGTETSGGFTGLMETADLAGTGNISILNGLVKASNLLSILKTVYPTETNTAVYGPLRKLDMNTWNKWVEAVGSEGVYGINADLKPVENEEELQTLIEKYAYGYNVKSGRKTEPSKVGQYGTAGGYVGYMKSGVITEANAWDAMNINAFKAAGGFAGEMATGGVAEVGGLDLLGIDVIGNTISALQTFVPVIKNSSVTGYQSGLRVKADTANQKSNIIINPDKVIEKIANFFSEEKVIKGGYAGGFVGHMIGGQIWGNQVVDSSENVVQKKDAIETVDNNNNTEKDTLIEDIEKTTTETDTQNKEDTNQEKNDKNTTDKTEESNNANENKENDADSKKESSGQDEISNTDDTDKEDISEDKSQTSEKIEPKVSTDAVEDETNNRCFVDNLRRVDGTEAVGGFAGLIEPGSAAALDTATSGGLLGGLLQKLITTPGDLLKVLDATLATVKAADVKAWDDWGIVVSGVYIDGNSSTMKYAKTAGGFAGEINGAIIGDKNNPSEGINIDNIRSVTAGEHVGGFFGLADVSAVAEISGEGETSIIGNLIDLGAVDVLDAFRTYIYSSKVTGAGTAGIEIHAKEGKKTEYINKPVYTGNAGGFGGTLLNGSVKDSSVENLRNVYGINYTGGFVGHSGKSGTVDLDSAGVLNKFLNATAGVLDVFGSHIEGCKVVGIVDKSSENGQIRGYSVISENRELGDKSEIAGGFVGYADLAKIDACSSSNLMQVSSGETAGGFAGETTFAYLVSVGADSTLVNLIFSALGQVLHIIYTEGLEELVDITIDAVLIKVKVLDNDVVELNILGLIVRLSIDKSVSEDYDLVSVEIGDSTIKLKCDKETGQILDGQESVKDEISINLIKANRTRISKSTVTGIPDGYDVYGSGSGNENPATIDNGYAGGFVGFNNEGLLEDNSMKYADVVRGPAEKATDLFLVPDGATGPFTGQSSLESNWSFNKLENIEGKNNFYRIYRKADKQYPVLKEKDGTVINAEFRTDGDWNNVYYVQHLVDVNRFRNLEDAYMANDSTPNEKYMLNVYQENGGKAVLMNDVPTIPLAPDGEPEPGDVQDPCDEFVTINLDKIWKEWVSGERPDRVTFYIYGTYKDSEGNEIWDDGARYEVTLTEEQMQDENTWKVYIKNLPAYFINENKEKVYYTYKIREEEIPDYNVSVDYEVTVENDKDDIYHIIVTNSKKWQYILPETGGFGTMAIYLLGIAALIIAALAYRKRYKLSKN